MDKSLDLFDEFSNLCPICLIGNPVEIDDTDNPNRAMIPLQPLYAYQCDTCGWQTAAYIQVDGYQKILDDRWQNISKIMIASARYRLGISIIANKLSATGHYFTDQMVA